MSSPCSINDSTRENNFKFSWERFRLENFLMHGVVQHWNRLPREMMESPYLEVFEIHGNVVLRDILVIDLAVLDL